MHDPLSDVVRLLRPRAVMANPITAKGAWAVRYAEYGLPSFCILLAGSCRLSVDGHAPITLQAGDFVLLARTPGFTLSSPGEAPPPIPLDPQAAANTRGGLRYGERRGRPDLRSLGGAFAFDGGDAALLAAMLPGVVHVRGSNRLTQLVRMVGEEAADARPGADYALTRLVELLLIESMRLAATDAAPPGLLRGLADARLARVLSQLHAQVDRPWTSDQLAKLAALSRSAFFERFRRVMGQGPMEYLLAWRMEIAKALLREDRLPVAEVAERVGYGSASAFSLAFRRQVGQAPGRYARSATGSL
ncbi:AraC family transcriptional regulator [Ideonella dechloratans]|uniref:AraC family transcriptional regulator n=1 Tax=Ideonella dechloratans TaxID=36863 RepID=A0A643F7I3_IDEDE|nr:AraC family transcriptional regulator [Ideonella dechloratans]KAB0575595.1 AraC family transcriptional regulator [Ideonella dechloratans]UFU12107.1 AraC family transcriptional regulator [Ideonella dechloratans]